LAGTFYRVFYSAVRIPFGVPIFTTMTAPHLVAARLLFQSATGFFDAAAAMVAKGRTAQHPFAFFVNLCFVYELSLKAFLAHRTWTESQIISLGHDLERALSECAALGYAPPPDVPETIKILGPRSKALDLRYLKDRAVDLPHPHERALAVAWSHLEAIAKQLPFSDIEHA
jgi:hypothetical protein